MFDTIKTTARTLTARILDRIAARILDRIDLAAMAREVATDYGRDLASHLAKEVEWSRHDYRTLADSIDLSEVGAEISTADLAAEWDACDLAAEIADRLDMDQLHADAVERAAESTADGISAEDLAQHLPLDEVAAHIDLTDLAANLDLADLAENVDTDALGQEVTSGLADWTDMLDQQREASERLAALESAGTAMLDALAQMHQATAMMSAHLALGLGLPTGKIDVTDWSEEDLARLDDAQRSRS